MPSSDIGSLVETTQSDQKETQSPFDRVYRGILRAIYEDTIIPGQRLAAPDLMRQFDAGRGTIREVLHRLASSGVVTIIPNRGAQVRLLTRQEVGALLDIVELLLGLAARGAADTVRDGKAGDILRIHHDRLQPPTSFDEFTRFVQAREDYYRCIVRLSGNAELQRLFPAAQVHIMRVQLRRFQNAADSTALTDYAALTDAILSGDPARAEQAGRDHVGYTRARIAALPDRAFARRGV
ncbi:GntR family transcriptional regulator [Novosphingobium sp.]|uniref:GntR family transcriptional regulator n=1 Tax=Novosphingobium sp. TaxID=1874826 RepID=UPI002FE1DF2A